MGGGGLAFECEKGTLAVEAAAIAREVARGADHPVAGHDDRDGVAPVRQSYGA